MGQFNRFARLKGGTGQGFRQIAKVKEYKKADEGLTGEGLCAAIALRWLADGTIPTTDEQLKNLAGLQKAYEDNLAVTKDPGSATAFLANECGFTVGKTFPTSFPNAPRQDLTPLMRATLAVQHWKQQGSFGTAISNYVNSETKTSLRLPCEISLDVDVTNIKFGGETYKPNSEGQFKINHQWQMLPYGGPHAVALKRADTGGYHCCDPNAGVYQIDEDALGSFFDTLHDCYEGFYANELGSENDDKIHVDLRLIWIHALMPSGSASAALLGPKRTGGRQPVKPKESSGSIATGAGTSEAEASPELKDFIAKKGLPKRIAQALAEYGITTLSQLKIVKEGDAPDGHLEKLRTILDESEILGARELIDGINVAEIEEEIADARSPDAKRARERRAQLAGAIQQVQELREKVVSAVGDDFTSVQTGVERDYNAVRKVINDVSGTDVAAAVSGGKASRQELIDFLDTAIKDATATRGLWDSVETKKRPVAQIIREQEMLCGFAINPAGAIRKYSELVKLPKNPDDMLKDSERAHKEFSFDYKGSKTDSFAASVAQQASATLATAAEASGAGFVGSGVAAVSAAAAYADSQKSSQEEQNFESASKARCGQIRYIYVPKKAVQFNQDDIRLSDAARQRLDQIVRLRADQQEDAIMEFYDRYGSHFFLRYSLGGRYQFTATGKSETKEAKGMLVAAVTNTTNWAVSVSGSYAGIGAAVTAAASVRGQKSVASASGDRFALNFDDAIVSVATEVIGGAGLVPRDVWAQSLEYNSTWTVVDRDQPRGIWELVASDATLDNDIKNMTPLLEKVWVRNIFLDAVKETDPVLYDYLKENTAISTCKSLKKAIGELNRDAKQLVKEPELNVVVAVATSEPAEWPRTIAGLSEKGLKLIGGGAIVDYGQGKGSMLTGSYPEGSAWVASAKSHKESCLARVTAYAIYVSDPDDLWDVTSVKAKSPEKSKLPQATAQLPAGYAMTGGGALVDWGGDGIMLTASCPQPIDGTYRAWTAKGKDHLFHDSGYATAWVFGIKPRNGSEPTPSKIDMRSVQGSNLPTLEKRPLVIRGCHCGRRSRRDLEGSGSYADALRSELKFTSEMESAGKRPCRLRRFTGSDRMGYQQERHVGESFRIGSAS
jgi:MAC/Perforin domain